MRNSWEQALDRWLTTPPEDEFESDVYCIDSFGCEINYGDKYYDINGMILSETSFDDCSHFLNEEDEMFQCCCCKNHYHIDSYTGKYYSINGDTFCEECATDCEMEADD